MRRRTVRNSRLSSDTIEDARVLLRRTVSCTIQRELVLRGPAGKAGVPEIGCTPVGILSSTRLSTFVRMVGRSPV